jgi:8-oxo-dGTP diphosphatase
LKPRYCPQCGHQMVVREQGGRPRETCLHCGYIHYYNPVPGVGVIVEINGGVVLVKRRFEPRAGWWCLPAGFLEADESAEEGAVRECKEETGLDVVIDDLFGVYSFPEGMQRSGLVIFYTAHVVGGKLRAGDDAVQARVFSLDALPDKLAFRTHREVLARLRQRATARKDLLTSDCAGDFPSPLPDVIIHHAHAEHLPQVLRLLRLIPANANLSDAKVKAVGQRFRESPDLEVLVAEADGQVVGFVALSYSPTLTGPKAWIDDIAVEPGYRRQGIGAALLEAAVRRARQRDCAYLLVNTAKGNPPAQAFYQACGFEEGGIAPLRIV